MCIVNSAKTIYIILTNIPYKYADNLIPYYLIKCSPIERKISITGNDHFFIA